MKKFLLIVGNDCGRLLGTEDWIGCFSTREEAEAQIKWEEICEYYSKGPRKGQIKKTLKNLSVNGINIYWYNIVDLEEWMNK
jgi:hypothetical protein